MENLPYVGKYRIFRDNCDRFSYVSLEDGTNEDTSATPELNRQDLCVLVRFKIKFSFTFDGR